MNNFLRSVQTSFEEAHISIFLTGFDSWTQQSIENLLRAADIWLERSLFHLLLEMRHRLSLVIQTNVIGLVLPHIYAVVVSAVLALKYLFVDDLGVDVLSLYNDLRLLNGTVCNGLSIFHVETTHPVLHTVMALMKDLFSLQSMIFQV